MYIGTAEYNRKWDIFTFLLEFSELKECAYYFEVESKFSFCCQPEQSCVHYSCIITVQVIS